MISCSNWKNARVLFRFKITKINLEMYLLSLWQQYSEMIDERRSLGSRRQASESRAK